MTDAAAQVNPFEPAAKRGPGRPAASPNRPKRSHHKKVVPGGTKEVAPKREPSIVPKYVYQGVGLFVVAGNGGLNFAGPRIKFQGRPDAEGRRMPVPMWTAEDALTGDELGALIQVLGDEALTNRALAEWLTKVGKASSANVHARLFYVLAQIAAPRLARRGMLPEELLGVIATFNQSIPAPAGEPGEGQASVGAPTADGFDFGAAGAGDIAPVPVATGGALDDDRGHGLGEIESGSVPEPGAPVVRDVPKQNGHRGLSGAAHQNGHGVGESQSAPAGAGTRA